VHLVSVQKKAHLLQLLMQLNVLHVDQATLWKLKNVPHAQVGVEIVQVQLFVMIAFLAMQ
jgi:hypothetical protein